MASVLKRQVVGESHGLVVKADGSWLRGRGFEPRHCVLDGLHKNSYTKITTIKVAKWGTPKKHLKKIQDAQMS
jgi:hypothetical protein